jgi:LmbE family N-acetylglucosaminyl deacetylase
MSLIQFKPLKPTIVLGVAAHPDDLDFGASATMAKFAADGADIHYLILTDGSKGSEDKHLTSRQLIKIRQEEQQTALLAIKGKGVTFLNYPDSYLEITMQLKEEIVREIRRLKPDVVITMDPTVIYSQARGFINHSDHRAAGQATIDAVFPLARDRLTFPNLLKEGLMPHKVKTLLLTNFDQQNFYVDVSNTLNQKFTALAAHASQIKDMEVVKERFTDLARVAGSKAGCAFAEGFMRLDMPL